MAAFVCSCNSPVGRIEVVEIDLSSEAQFADLASRQDQPPVQIDRQGRTLFVPQGQRLNLYLRLQGASRLLIDQARLTAEGSCRLLFQRDGARERLLEEIAGDRREIVHDLSVGPSDFARISIACQVVGPPDGGLLLLSPRIENTAVDAAPQLETTPTAERPNIIVFLVDTLRKDHLGIYGHQVPVSPELDAFAQTSTTYDRAVAQSTWTRPAVASILTGLEPHLHGVNRRADALPQKVQTLAEVLTTEGYHTAAFITNGNVGSEYQFDQGFRFFSRSRQQKHRAAQLNERVFKYLDDIAGPRSAPLFLYVHAVDPHAPYAPPEPFRERFAAEVEDPKFGEIEFLNGYHKRQELPEPEVIDKALSLYNAEIAYLDHEFGRFLQGLKDRDLFDNSMIVFVSDHGEEFWEHGDWSHGQSLFGELLDMPLVIKDPGQQGGRRSSRLAQHIDIFATALDWAGLASDSYGRGHSLREPAGDDTTAYSKIDVDGRIGISIVHDDWKLVVPRTGNLGLRPQLFDRATDPGETRDLWNERRIMGGYLMTELRRHEAPSDLAVESEEKEASEELARELEALGYIN